MVLARGVPRARSRQGGALAAVLLLLALAAGSVWGLNRVQVARPVATALAEDSRNSGYTLAAHYEHYVNPSVIVLDLTRVESVAPVDLMRGLFQSAKALAAAGRRPTRVVLAGAGSPVYVMKGDDFTRLGEAYAMGENPMYLSRTLPEKLYDPDGTAAFGTWTGGLLGVSLRQMEDVTAFGRAWARAAD